MWMQGLKMKVGDNGKWELGVCNVIETEDMGSFINGDGRLVNDKVVEDGGEGVMLMMARW